MVVELIRRRWCDGCLLTHPNGERTQLPEDYTPILIDLGHGRRNLDVCERCEQDLSWMEMVQLYIKEGRPVKSGQTVKARPLPGMPPTVTIPSPPTPPPPRQTSLLPVGKGSTGTADKQPCPFCPKQFAVYSEARAHIRKAHDFDPEGIPAVCPLCAENAERINTVGGLRMHVSRVHGFSVLGSMVEAKRMGDPRGAWAAVQRLMGAEVAPVGETSESA